MHDRICAIATAQGEGAIGVVRASGKESISRISEVFSRDLNNKNSHTTHFGLLRDNKGEIVDEVLITIFHEGKSYTGEESVEISCHGSPYILAKVLELLGMLDFRLAEPGEFTKRAFVNGKLDLSQAEAVADLIASQSKRAHDIALNQLRGQFSHELKELREKLINFSRNSFNSCEN